MLEGQQHLSSRSACTVVAIAIHLCRSVFLPILYHRWFRALDRRDSSSLKIIVVAVG